MSHEEYTKGITGLAAIWSSWLIAHLATIQTGLSILASIAAITASIIYARYWLIKTRKER